MAGCKANEREDGEREESEIDERLGVPLHASGVDRRPGGQTHTLWAGRVCRAGTHPNPPPTLG